MTQAIRQTARRSKGRGQTALSASLADPPRTVAVRASDGTILGARVYEPEGAVRGNVLIHGATAVPQRFYALFARALASEGLRTITYDYRGVGASRPRVLEDYQADMADWARLDARAMHRYVREHHPGLSLAVVGHSFGAQLIGLLDEVREADAALLIGGQLGYYGFWPQPSAAGLRVLWSLIVPALSAWRGYMPGQAGLGEDLPRGVALQWARWCSHPLYLISEFPEASARFARFAVPVRAYSFTDDAYAPSQAVDALLQRLTGTSVDHRRLSPSDLALVSVGHFGFFRQAAGARLWGEVKDFLLQHVSDDASAQRERFAQPV
jgi:predicted alpha/beta hydrolase